MQPADKLVFYNAASQWESRIGNRVEQLARPKGESTVADSHAVPVPGPFGTYEIIVPEYRLPG
jgi:hypothetical protein